MNPRPITIQIQLEPDDTGAYDTIPFIRQLVAAFVNILEEQDIGYIRSEVFLGEEVAPE